MRALIYTAVIAIASGCGGGDDGGGGYTLTDDLLTFETGTFEVGGGDYFECFYTDVVTDRELAVRGAYGTQSAGGHHITVYYTRIKQDVQHHPCDDAEMADWRMIGGTGGDSASGDSDLRLPDGLGIRVPAGVQIVLQVHYINTGATFTTDDSVSVELVDPAGLDAFVNQFVVNDDSFIVPAHGGLERVQTCRVPRDLQLVKLLGHMHEWGMRFQLEEIDDQDQPIGSLLDVEWQPIYASHPPILTYQPDQPLEISAGTRLRQTCQWENDEDYDLRFPREMCVTFGFYFPDDGELFCDPE